MRQKRTLAFTLLEVMIAMAILAIALGSIMSSQVGAVRAARRARDHDLAVVMARCKMGEIDERLAKDGFPAVALTETDNCCTDSDLETYECEWSVDRVVLPDVPEDAEPGEDPLTKLAAAGGSSGAPGERPDPTKMMESADPGGFEALAISIAYPVVKPSIEDQVRRVTCKVKWKEGDAERSFEVVRYIVTDQSSPQQGAVNEAIGAGQVPGIAPLTRPTEGPKAP